MKKASAKIGVLAESRTTMFDSSKASSDTAWRATRNPTLIAASSFPDSDDESPSSREVIMGTAPSSAGLNVGAGDGLGLGAVVGDMVDGGTPCPAEQEIKGYSTPLNSEVATVPGMVIADAVA